MQIFQMMISDMQRSKETKFFLIQLNNKYVNLCGWNIDIYNVYTLYNMDKDTNSDYMQLINWLLGLKLSDKLIVTL